MTQKQKIARCQNSQYNYSTIIFMFGFFRFHSQISLAVISVRINEWFVISKNEFNYFNSIELQIFEKKKKIEKKLDECMAVIN